MNAFIALRPYARQSIRSFVTSTPRSDLAKMALIGRIGGEPQMKQTKNGKDFLVYKVATTDPLGPVKEGETRPEPTTSWHTIFAYGPACERLATIEKGTLVHVEASFQVVNEKNENTGDYSTNIFAKHERLTVIKRPNKESTEESTQ